MSDSSERLKDAPQQPINAPPRKRLRSAGPWGFWATSGWFVLAMFLGLIWSPKFNPLLDDFSVFVFYIVAVLVLAGAARLSQLPVLNYFALQRPERKDLTYFMAGVAILAIVAAIELLLYFRLGVANPDGRFLREAVSVGMLPRVLASALIFAPICEELIFRGFLFRGWSQTHLGPAGAIGFTTVLFGWLHARFSMYTILDVMCFGVVAGWARWRSGSIIAPTLLHFTKNSYAMMLLLLS